MAKKSGMRVQVTSKGVHIGTLDAADFRRYVGGRMHAFLPDLVKQFNAYKESIGEPERAEMLVPGIPAKRK